MRRDLNNLTKISLHSGTNTLPGSSQWFAIGPRTAGEGGVQNPPPTSMQHTTP